jgi:hypothetical protein
MPALLFGPVEFLTASGCTQCRHEAVTDQRVDACDVGSREPTGEATHDLELIKSSATPLAYLEVPFDAPSLVFSQVAIDIVGDHVD